MTIALQLGRQDLNSEISFIHCDKTRKKLLQATSENGNK